MDEKLLARIDREAGRRGLSRSTYLSQLAARELDAGSGPGRQPSARRALGKLDRLFEVEPAHEDATRAVRAERDSH